jgi:type I restriction enzyme S subunit
MKGHYLPENWTVEKSQVYCARVADGTHDTPKQVPEGKILVTSKNIKNGKVNFDGCYLISENDYSQINKRSKVDKGDVLFSMIGTVGEIAFVDEEPSYAIKNIGLFKTKSFSDGKWLYYYLTSKIGQAALDTFLTGTSQQFVSLGDLRKVPVIRAPQKNQRKIAAVLSAYDDLIENNNRRIAILKAMAEELYREWFVRLRFPGHEKTKITKGVPEGWEVKTLGEICFEERKLIKKKNISDETRYIGLEHISPRTIITKDYGYAVDIQSDKLVFSQLDILFGKIRPYLHKVSIAHFNGVCSSDIIVIKSIRPENQAFVYLIVSSNSFIDLATTASTGTKMPRADWDFLIKQKIIYPEIGILKQFQKIFDNSLSAIFNYQKRNEMLQHSRDRLLSRLMSGKIDVENLDIQFPDSMKEEAVANA